MEIETLKTLRFLTCCFHPEKNHLFYLASGAEDDGPQEVIQYDLNSGCVYAIFTAPRIQNSPSPFYNLIYHKKMDLLILSYPPNNLCVWDVATQSVLLAQEVGGKNPYLITSVAYSTFVPSLYFSALGQRNIYHFNINSAIE